MTTQAKKNLKNTATQIPFSTKGTLYEQLEDKLRRNQNYYAKYLSGSKFSDIQHSSETPISWTAVKAICTDFANTQNKLIVRMKEIDNVCELYFIQNKSGIEIAKELGVTRQAIYKIIRKKYDVGVDTLH